MIARAQRTADQQREIDVSLGLPRELRGWRIENAINAREGRKAVRLIAWAVDAGGPSVMPFQSSARRRPALTSTRAPAGRAAGATPVPGQRG
jgi:hypothetical protein